MSNLYIRKLKGRWKQPKKWFPYTDSALVRWVVRYGSFPWVVRWNFRWEISVVIICSCLHAWINMFDRTPPSASGPSDLLLASCGAAPRSVPKPMDEAIGKPGQTAAIQENQGFYDIEQFLNSGVEWELLSDIGLYRLIDVTKHGEVNSSLQSHVFTRVDGHKARVASYIHPLWLRSAWHFQFAVEGSEISSIVFA